MSIKNVFQNIEKKPKEDKEKLDLKVKKSKETFFKRYIKRDKVILAFLVVLFMSLFLRGIYMNYYDSEFLNAELNKRIINNKTLYSTRGTIYDNNKTPIAMTYQVSKISLNTYHLNIDKHTDKLKELAILINENPEKLISDLKKEKKNYVIVAKNIDLPTNNKIVNLKIPTLNYELSQKRYYPMGEVYSQIIGFADSYGQGIEGIELSKNELLKNTNGKDIYIQDGNKQPIASVETIKGTNGKDIELTIDTTIQTILNDELKNTYEKFKADNVSAVLIDAKNGDIIAMGSYPTFDPNNISVSKQEDRKNRVALDIFEPGSTFKPFIVAKALSDGKINKDTMFNTRPYTIGKFPVRDTHVYEQLTTTGIIQKSSNVGTSKIIAKYPRKEVHEFFSDIGVGHRMKQIPFYQGSRKIKSADKWGDLDVAVMSFGYSLEMNLLQLARAYTMFTTDGKLLPLRLIKGEKSEDEVKQMITPKAAKDMREMLHIVTLKGGTATMLNLDGFNAAAKTGTARKVVNGKYSPNQHSGLLVGFAPYENPQFIMAIRVDSPKQGGYYGGVVSSDLFNNVGKEFLRKRGTIPTEKPSEEKIK